MEKTVNLAQSKQWAAELVQNFSDQQIVLLEGDLGAGKTQWVQLFVEALGGGEAFSPTYSVINEYSLGNKKVVHVDLYRLETEDEIESVGFWDIFSGPAVVFIEWPQRINKSDLPLDWQKLHLKISKTDSDLLRLVEAR